MTDSGRNQIVNPMAQAAIIRDPGPDHDRGSIETIRRVIFGGCLGIDYSGTGRVSESIPSETIA